MKGILVFAICFMLVLTAQGWRFPEPSTPGSLRNPSLEKSNFSWEWTGPEGGTVEQIVVDPVDFQNAYAITLMDIWVTSNGVNWQLIDEFTYRGGNKAVVAVGPERAIAAIENGLWYTPNGGASWTNLMSFENFACMTEAPSETVLVVYENDTLELTATLDGGFTWDTLNVLPYQRAHAITFLPGTDSTIFLGVEQYDTVLIVRSTNRGETWQTVWKEDTLHISGMSDIEINPWNTDEIFVSVGMAGDGPTGLLYSTDGGGNWNWLPSSQTYEVLFPTDVEFKDENTLLAANLMPAGIFEGQRVPGPEEWIFTSIYSQTGGSNIDIFDSDSIWAGTVAGVIKSTDGGTVWAEANSDLKAVTPLSWFGPISSTVSGISADEMYVVIGLGNPVYKTEDGGQTWSRSLVPSLFLNMCVAAYAPAPDTAYIAGLGVSDTAKQWMFHSLYKTTDGGENWMPIDTLPGDAPDSLPFHTGLWISTTDSRVLLAALDDDILRRSTDGGRTWDTLFTYLQYPPIGTDTVFIQEADYIRVSYDAGSTWNSLLLVTSSVRAMSYDPFSNYLFVAYGDSLYRITLSADVTPLISVPYDYQYLSLDAANPGRLFLCYYDFSTSISHLLRSFDNGNNFETDTLDIIPVVVRVGDDAVLVGDLGKSFWRSEDAFTGICEKPVVVVESTRFRIFPVPFSSRLTIRFMVERNSLANVVLYDLAGRKVNTILKNMLSAGSHEFEYDASELPQGVYFYDAKVGDNFYRGKLMKISP